MPAVSSLLLGWGLVSGAPPLIGAEFPPETRRIVPTPLVPLMPGRSEADEGIGLPGPRPTRSSPAPTADSVPIDPRWKIWAQWPTCPDVPASALATNFVYWSKLAVPWSYGRLFRQWQEQATDAQVRLTEFQRQRTAALPSGSVARLAMLYALIQGEQASLADHRAEAWPPATLARRVFEGLSAPWDKLGLAPAIGAILAEPNDREAEGERVSVRLLNTVQSRLRQLAGQAGTVPAVSAEALRLDQELRAIQARLNAGDAAEARRLAWELFNEALNVSWTVGNPDVPSSMGLSLADSAEPPEPVDPGSPVPEAGRRTIPGLETKSGPQRATTTPATSQAGRS